MRMPGCDIGRLAATANGTIHSARIVAFPRLSFRIRLAPVALTRLHLRFPLRSLLVLDEPILFAWRKQERIGIGFEILPQNQDRLRSENDVADMPPCCGLVPRRRVNPNRTALVQVTTFEAA